MAGMRPSLILPTERASGRVQINGKGKFLEVSLSLTQDGTLEIVPTVKGSAKAKGRPRVLPPRNKRGHLPSLCPAVVGVCL